MKKLTKRNRRKIYLAIAKYIANNRKINDKTFWVCYLMAGKFQKMTGITDGNSMLSVVRAFPEFGLFLFKDKPKHDQDYDSIRFSTLNFESSQGKSSQFHANTARVTALLLCAEMCK